MKWRKEKKILKSRTDFQAGIRKEKGDDHSLKKSLLSLFSLSTLFNEDTI